MTVDVSAVERELARIQRELTSTEVRTSLFNLVIFSPDAEKTMADDALNFLLGKRAARVIHVVNRNLPESNLEVSARCFVDAHRRGVCFQEIVITNGRDGAGGAPGSWVPLLVRDIPTFVLWLDTISDRRELLSHAQEQAEKLLVDSEHSIALGDSEQEVLTALREIVVEGIPVSDFAFKRLRPLQRIVASAFDAPDRTPLLEQVTGVRLAGVSHVAARLFSLWVAERLGWKAQNGAFRDRRGRVIQVRHQTEVDGCDGEVVLELEGGETVDVRIQEAGCADVDFPEGARTHPVMVVPTSGELLLEEVDNMNSDALYHAALSVL